MSVDTMAKLIEHHTHYKELHGFDRTVWLTPSEHKLLHIRLRKDGKCNISVDELKKISNAACGRTEKAILRNKKYNDAKRYQEYKSKYRKQNQQRIEFYDTIAPNIQHREMIDYNIKTGTISITCSFKSDHGKKLHYINTH